MCDERPSMFADMIVIVEGIVTVAEQRYDLYSWYMLLVVGGSRICNQIYLIPRAATKLWRERSYGENDSSPWTPVCTLTSVLTNTSQLAQITPGQPGRHSTGCVHRLAGQE